MHGLLYRLRGIQSWPETQASVIRIDELSRGGRGGDWNRVAFTYKPKAADVHAGDLKVNSYSSLFNIAVGDTFPLQYDPRRPDRFYSEESQTLFSRIHYAILALGMLFAAAVLIINAFRL